MKKFLTSWSLLLLLTSCSTWSHVDVDTEARAIQSHTSADGLKDAVDSLVNPLVDQKMTPGLVVGVLLPDGGMRFFCYGVTDKKSMRCPDKNTLFAVGSISKGVLSTTLAVLIQEGVLSWDDTLEDSLPIGTPLSDDAKRITLLQLATHTSGLPRQPRSLKTLAYFIQYLFTGKNFYRHLDSDCLVDYLKTFKSPKVSLPKYSNIGYALLGYILELHTEKNLEVLVYQKVITPLVLNSTSYVPEQLSGYDFRAHGHAGDQPKFVRRGRRVPAWTVSGIMAGGVSLHSTAADLLIYANAFLRGSGNPLIDRAMKDMLSVRFEQPKKAATVAWSVDTVSDQKIVFQFGVISGYACYLGMNLKSKSAVVVLQNALNWDYTLGHQLLFQMGKGNPKNRNSN